MTDRAPVFAAIKALRANAPFSSMEVAQVDDLLDRLGIARPGATVPAAQADAIDVAAIKHLRREEGERFKAYRDHLGYWTIGIGRLIDPRKGGRITPGEESVLLVNDPRRKSGDWRNWTLTPAESAYLLANDIARFRTALETRPGLAPAWNAVKGDTYRAVALISMAFQMGVDGLDGFDNTLAMVAAGRFAEAAANARKSKWATKDTPGRALRVTTMLETGREIT